MENDLYAYVKSCCDYKKEDTEYIVKRMVELFEKDDEFEEESK